MSKHIEDAIAMSGWGSTGYFLVIGVDGSVTRHDCDEVPSFEQLREAVGGYIERAVHDSTLSLWVNEDGIALGLRVNLVGTALSHSINPKGSALFGPVVVAGPDDEIDPAELGPLSPLVEPMVGLAAQLLRWFM